MSVTVHLYGEHTRTGTATANMKNQYFGDVNDYRKYGLLRLLGAPPLSLGVIWMLTPPDGRSDGRFLDYLEKPQTNRPHDPQLFDWLVDVVHTERDRRIARIEASELLAKAVYVSSFVPDGREARAAYFTAAQETVKGVDLVFLDPDNGFEVKSKPVGKKDSSKYVCWNEVQSLYMTGASVLVYQHFRREKREPFIAQLGAQLQAVTGAPQVMSFQTPNVVFFLAAQERHQATLTQRASTIAREWSPHIQTR